MRATGSITLNGEVVALHAGETINTLIVRLGIGARGIAVARNGEVVPRSEWEVHPLLPGDVLEILAPVQGG